MLKKSNAMFLLPLWVLLACCKLKLISFTLRTDGAQSYQLAASLNKTHTVSSSECVATGGSVIDELRRIWKDVVVAYFEVLSCRYQGRLGQIAGDVPSVVILI